MQPLLKLFDLRAEALAPAPERYSDHPTPDGPGGFLARREVYSRTPSSVADFCAAPDRFGAPDEVRPNLI